MVLVFDLLREVARRRLDRAANPSPEEWAKQVEEARSRGYKLIRVDRSLDAAARYASPFTRL